MHPSLQHSSLGYRMGHGKGKGSHWVLSLDLQVGANTCLGDISKSPLEGASVTLR